ncbi:MAG: protein-L-isoaspartate(D-aspartate) O-methyltransferase [Lentisphaeria bacterium]|nr:protein-L-isoaspartate(D-aspartate) O-methyltransferase [Lentisphaeria bacterium]
MRGSALRQDWGEAREQMLAGLIRYGIRDDRVLEAMRRVPRHRFIPDTYRNAGAYGDHPSPIGYGQTISQPYIVAYMIEKLDVHPGSRVLEIGTGCGYQAAVLAAMGAEVYSVERIPALSRFARTALDDCRYESVRLRTDDGYAGWPEEAPFDRILAACCPPEVPPALADQLAVGGRMVLPVGTDLQRLVVVSRGRGSLERRDDLWVRFVPMVSGPPRQAEENDEETS